MVGKELLHLENTLCESAASITLLNRWILSLADLLIFNDNDDCKDWFDGDFARFAIVKMMIVFVDNDDRDDVGLDEGIEVQKLMNQMQKRDRKAFFAASGRFLWNCDLRQWWLVESVSAHKWLIEFGEQEDS